MFTGVFTLGNKVSTFYAPKTGFFVKVVGFKGMKADFTPEGIDACVASMKETNAKSITFACTPSFDSSSAYLVGVHVTLGVLHADDDSFDSKLEKMKNWIAKVPTDFTFYASGFTKWGPLLVILVQFDSMLVEASLRYFASLGSYERGQEGKPKVYHFTMQALFGEEITEDSTEFVLNKKFDDQADETIESYGKVISRCVFHKNTPDEELLKKYSHSLALDFNRVLDISAA